jgi:hypothetical protein
MARGRIINLEGRPLSGLSVRVVYVNDFPADLLAKVRENGGEMPLDLWNRMHDAFIPGQGYPLSPVRTGPDGRFRMTGVGQDRLPLLVIEGGPVERTHVLVLTSTERDYKPIRLPAVSPGQQKIHGPRFELAVAPGRVVEGTVRDRDTGRPIAGARIRSWFMDTLTTDAQGRFRFEGQPKAGDSIVQVTVEREPYISAVRSFNEASGLEPVHLDIVLKRGVWVEGKVTDAVSGKPVKANVVYYPFRNNPLLKDCPDASVLNNNPSDEVEFPTDENGGFRAIGLPGKGLLIVTASEPGYQDARPIDPKLAENTYNRPGLVYRFQASLPIDTPTDKTLVIPDISLTPGRAQHLRIIGPDGRPLRGARISGLQGLSVAGNSVPGDELTVTHLEPGRAGTIVIVQEGHSLGATIGLKGDEPDPVRVVLHPTGAVTGRLVDEDGRPRPGVPLAIDQRLVSPVPGMRVRGFEPLKTGPDGRFRVEKLVPGVPYALSVGSRERNLAYRYEGYLQQRQWTVKPGEVQDWGDVQARPYRP